jgi:hypothetical protein
VFGNVGIKKKTVLEEIKPMDMKEATKALSHENWVKREELESEMKKLEHLEVIVAKGRG